jgi:hypothetical protein
MGQSDSLKFARGRSRVAIRHSVAAVSPVTTTFKFRLSRLFGPEHARTAKLKSILV